MLRFRDRVAGGPNAFQKPWSLGPELGRELLESMLLARHLDLAAHELRASGHGHYTICSTGHESNVVLGRLTRLTDPALLHYRSSALVIERARKFSKRDIVEDIALSLVASAEEPTSGGRHKVFGSRPLGIIPQTSTISSHLPRALGLAVSLDLRARLGVRRSLPDDSLVIASFGDASVNHSTALGAFNAAGWTAHQNLPAPLLFVCEDNGLGISVRSPPGWVELRLKALPHVRYFTAPGTDLSLVYQAANAAIEHVRTTRRPAVLHLLTERLLGHAGSDVDTAYRTPKEIEAALERDPVLAHALSLLAAGVLSSAELLELDQVLGERVRRAAERAVTRPKLESREQVMSTIALPLSLSPPPTPPRPQGPAVTLAQGINHTLGALLEEHPEALVFGEDVAKKGGVYGVTKGLYERFGPARVFNTLLDEQTILGFALGAAVLGLLPIPEIQYLAYLHNAEDQLRGEAATLRFFSAGAFENPMIVRIAGLAYQKGFGGHFHNDHSLAVLRDLPGVVVGVPARAGDASAMLRTACRLAIERRRVVVLVEPIALYHRRDLYAEGDNGWLEPVSDGAGGLEPRVYREAARDVLLVTYGNGVLLSLRAARRLEAQGIEARVLDLRWLVPLPVDELLRHAREVGRVLVVDECRSSGNVGEALVTELTLSGFKGPVGRVAAPDCFVPLGDAAELVLVSEDEVVENALALTRT